MSILKSVLGSLSPPPRFRRSFEDPHARDHELPLYNSPPSPRVPPPVTSSVLWTAPKTSLTPAPRVPENLLALQRRAQHLERQLQELLDAQSDALVDGLAGEIGPSDDLVSNGSTTPTVSSTRSTDRSTPNGSNRHQHRKKKIGLNAARLGISKRIRQLADVKAEELDLLDGDLRHLEGMVEKSQAWSQKRSRLVKKIQDIEGKSAGKRGQDLQREASKLELDIQHREDELRALKRRQKQVLDELADTENSVEAKLSSYKTSVVLLDREIANFLVRPAAEHISLCSSPFSTLPTNRRTLGMAHEYWQDEYTRLAEKCEEVDTDRDALDEGAVMWSDVIRKVADYESGLQDYLRQVGRQSSSDSSKLLDQIDSTITLLEEKLEFASAKSWNLLVCAIGAELEAFKQGKGLLEDALGLTRKGKEKVAQPLLDDNAPEPGYQEMTGSTIRINRSPGSPPTVKQQLFDTDDENEDPDPELLISHQDPYTD